MTKTLVVAVGNIRRADEGAGVHTLRYLKKHYDLPGTSYIEAATAPSSLVAEIAAADHLIILDAAQIDADPGTVRVVEGEEVDLGKLVDLAELDGTLPARYALISIQPGLPASGGSLSETVRRSLPKAAGNAATLIHRWRRSESVFSTGLHSLPNSV